jgi:uncharacterized protein (TIGR00369 family)
LDPKPLTLSELRRLIPKMAFDHHLNLRVVRKHRDGLTVECPVRPELLNRGGYLHGGVWATVADAAVGIALVAHLGLRRMTTVEMKVNYFVPVERGKLVARAKLIRTGRTICVGSVDLRDDRRRLAGAALVTYMLL